MAVDPALTRESSRVTLEMTDGTRLESRVDAAKGTRKNPVTLDDLRTKFMHCAAGRLSDAEAERASRDHGADRQGFRSGALLRAPSEPEAPDRLGHRARGDAPGRSDRRRCQRPARNASARSGSLLAIAGEGGLTLADGSRLDARAGVARAGRGARSCPRRGAGRPAKWSTDRAACLSDPANDGLLRRIRHRPAGSRAPCRPSPQAATSTLKSPLRRPCPRRHRFTAAAEAAGTASRSRVRQASPHRSAAACGAHRQRVLRPCTRCGSTTGSGSSTGPIVRASGQAGTIVARLRRRHRARHVHALVLPHGASGRAAVERVLRAVHPDGPKDRRGGACRMHVDVEDEVFAHVRTTGGATVSLSLVLGHAGRNAPTCSPSASTGLTARPSRAFTTASSSRPPTRRPLSGTPTIPQSTVRRSCRSVAPAPDAGPPVNGYRAGWEAFLRHVAEDADPLHARGRRRGVRAGVVALGQPLAGLVADQAVMVVVGHRQVQQCLQQHGGSPSPRTGRRRAPPGDPLRGVVHHHRQVVGGADVAPREHDVAQGRPSARVSATWRPG
jgi:hypothetical protein